MRRTGHVTLHSHELSRYNISIAGISESRWCDRGEKIEGEHNYIWSCPNNNNGLYGIALAMPKQAQRCLIGWTPINGRLTAHFHHQQNRLTISRATDVADEQTKDAFYGKLHQIAQKVPPHDISIVLRDLNVTISLESHWLKIRRSHHQTSDLQLLSYPRPLAWSRNLASQQDLGS